MPEEDSNPRGSKRDVELQGEHQVKDCKVEEKLEAEVEPAASTGANAVDDKDSGSLNDHQESHQGSHQGSIVDSTCEETVNGKHEEAVNRAHRRQVDGNRDNLDGTHEKSVDISYKEALNGAYETPVDRVHDSCLDGTHEAPVDGNRDNEFLDGTLEEAVAHGEPVEGMQEETAGHKYEELVCNAREESMTNTSVAPVPGSRDEPLNNNDREAIVTGTLQDSSSHQDLECPSEPQLNRTKGRGKTKWQRLPEYDKPRPSL